MLWRARIAAAVALSHRCCRAALASRPPCEACIAAAVPLSHITAAVPLSHRCCCGALASLLLWRSRVAAAVRLLHSEVPELQWVRFPRSMPSRAHAGMLARCGLAGRTSTEPPHFGYGTPANAFWHTQGCIPDVPWVILDLKSRMGSGISMEISLPAASPASCTRVALGLQ